ncbi:MAG: uracil-DNA glycosylase [Acetobacteraceae bacterium]
MDADALILLRLLVDWGADEAIEDAPLNRLAPAPTLAPPPRPAPPRPAPTSRAPAAERADEVASSADTLAALRAAIAGFEAIGLRDTATGPVLFEGAADADILLVLPPPSAEEDRALRVMAGETGAFLAAMLASIGLRERVLLAPLIPWRPPGDRPPSPAELAICLPFLHRLVALAHPRLAVLLGPLAARALLGTERRPGRGRFTDAIVPGRAAPLPCLPMTAPAQVRGDPAARPVAWAELRLLRRRIEQEVTSK